MSLLNVFQEQGRRQCGWKKMREGGNVVGCDAAGESKSQIMRARGQSKECSLTMTPGLHGRLLSYIAFFSPNFIS